MLILFNKLDKDEILRFEKVVTSPYFNTVENVKKLFYYLKSRHPDISDAVISQNEISRVIFPNEPCSQDKIWKLKSDFSKVFEKFLIQNELESDSMYSDLALLKALRKKGSVKEFQQQLNKLKKERSKQFIKDDVYYLNNILINEEEFYFTLPKVHFEHHKNLQAKSDNLDYFFLFMKLHTFHEMYVYQYQNSKPLNLNKTFYNNLIDFVEYNKSEISSDHPNVYVIYLVLMMFHNSDDDGHSLKFKRYLKLNEKKFSKTQFSYYYKYLESFYHTKINEGQINFRDELFEVYKIMFDKDLFTLENSITDKDFNNVINISLPLGKFRWTELFIEKYRYFIQPELASESYNLAKAKLYFYKKEFTKIFPYLNLIHFTDPHYYFNSKILLAKVFYETNAFDSLSSTLESLRKYLSREKNLNEPTVAGLKNFIKYISFLMKIKNGSRSDEVNIFEKSIENDKKFISSKNWFLEKIEELKEKKL